MIAADFIAQVRVELQEKSEFWTPEELLIKLQRSYRTLQSDVPFFTTNEHLVIKKGKSSCYLQYPPEKDVQLILQGVELDYIDIDNFYTTQERSRYTFSEDQLLIKSATLEDALGEITYKYIKELENENCHIELPKKYYEALRMLFMAKIHEKPTRNSKERNLSDYYLKLYNGEKNTLKGKSNLRTHKAKTTYQVV